jgi:magnesium-transporting ATPase (P-type)
MAYNLGYDFREVRTRVGEKIKKIIPFSSDRKRMSIV